MTKSRTIARSSCALVSAALALTACTPEPPAFDKLHIESVEVGPVPASTMPEAPAQEGVVAWRRENAGILRAYYRKTIPCPSRMINSVSGVQPERDRIVLCFEPVEATSPVARPLSACPYELVISYEMRGIPESVEPKFEARDGCIAK